ncbi:MAG: terpene cyclase/mutase family protein [Planctomycetaceae bacterium]|nr:terpene cyclase/mutase family protein [Planctomycetaceae bacterium]
MFGTAALLLANPLTAGLDAKAVDAARQKAVNFLKTAQNDDGNWTSGNLVGVTGVITVGLLDAGLPPSDDAVAKSLKYLEGYVQQDGGIYESKSNHRNYETAIAVSAFTRANADGRYDDVIKGAEKFLKALQWDEAEGKEPSDPYYGGAGYGGHSRPDLSNTSFFVEALREAGVKEDDPAMQKALLFISRCQNLEGEHNTTPFAAKIDDGGFYYTPAAGGTSQAGTEPNGGLRSYGSMTYAGLKSMIYAGLDKNDPRAKAAYDWARKHYTVSENPGLGEQGLYYYYQTLAKALDLLEVEQFEDAGGVKHDWRADLAAELLRRQNENGSWVNTADRWYEGDPNLVTAYTLMALNRVQPPKK